MILYRTKTDDNSRCHSCVTILNAVPTSHAAKAQNLNRRCLLRFYRHAHSDTAPDPVFAGIRTSFLFLRVLKHDFEFLVVDLVLEAASLLPAFNQVGDVKHR